MRFSVVIPTKDRPVLLQSAIASVLNQHEQDFEIIVVNDGHESVAIPQDRRLTVIRSDGEGVAAARNAGIAAARGDYLAFLDDDDLYMPSRLDVADVPVSVCWRREARGVTLYGWWPQPSAHVGQVTIKRELCPSFDERFTRTEDVDWWLTLVERHRPLEQASVGYHLRAIATDRLTCSSDEEIARCMVRLLSKHPSWFSSHPQAAAFNWKRAGVAARKSTYLWRSFRLRPRPKTFARMILTTATRSRP